MEFKRQKYMNALVERMHNGMIKVVTGIRRSGKSYLLFNLFARYLMQQGTAMDHILTMQLDRWDMRRDRDRADRPGVPRCRTGRDGVDRGQVRRTRRRCPPWFRGRSRPPRS